MFYLGKNIRFLRKRKGWTQEELANRIGKKKSIIGNYEKGVTEPNLGILMRLGELFGVYWAHLVDCDLTGEQDSPFVSDEIQQQIGVYRRQIEKLEQEKRHLEEQLRQLK
ncbi:helix-turn-helix domain-containing protein [Thermonema rossianum]|uniref:helix-turn-helix domain-containing protein n=1 Tax=Thermonema rossianum TaxID=55505 RepID=UPI00068D15C8|nr:helix-turn-helix transcriptional regulator [Thermonema rossianum]